jgi:outer membrane usher protein
LDRYRTVSAHRSEGNGVGRWETSIDAQHFGQSDAVSANGSLAYYGNRAEVRLAHTASTREIAQSGLAFDPDRQRSSLRVGSSLAFADGVVAVGAPIRSGAFAIVYPHESVAGKTITVGDADAPRAYANSWGAAVVTNVPAYAPTNFGVDVADLPVGYSLGAGAFDLQAGYKTGYALEVGSNDSVSVYGTLLQANGEPVALTSGTAQRVGPNAKTIPLFTNATGKFGAEGLGVGRWIIEMSTDGAPLQFAIDVPKGMDGLYKVGALRPIGAATQ